MDSLVVKENTVMMFAVFPERLAMIGHHGDNRIVVQAARSQTSKEFPHRRVGVSNFPIVRFRPKASLVGLRRFVGSVRIIAVHPNKEWAWPVRVEPTESAIDHCFGPALDAPIPIFPFDAIVEGRVVGIESTAKTG